MMRTGAAVVKAEAIGTIPALSRGARWHSAGNRMSWVMDNHPVLVDVGSLLYQLCGIGAWRLLLSRSG
jgi:hypothetical protein